MTVSELIEQLKGLPDDARVVVVHELIGDYQYITRVEWQKNYHLMELNNSNGVVVLHECLY